MLAFCWRKGSLAGYLFSLSSEFLVLGIQKVFKLEVPKLEVPKLEVFKLEVPKLEELSKLEVLLER